MQNSSSSTCVNQRDEAAVPSPNENGTRPNLIQFLSDRNNGGNVPSSGAAHTTASSSRGTNGIFDIMEHSFLSANTAFDFPMPPSVLSTIAIALSPNGETVATTHGDHTVKIFEYESATILQVLVGHPRTPWTVKYHPYNPNIIASGCLGFEVRVWDISDGLHLTTVRYDYSIISLSFHPILPVLAVASGPKLYMFNWQDHAARGQGVPSDKPQCNRARLDAINATTSTFRAYKKRCSQEATSSNAVASSRCSSSSGCTSSNNSGFGTPDPAAGGRTQPQSAWHMVQHSRNIRAVLFHPDGQYLLLAAPDPPRASAVTYTACRLYFFDIESVRVGNRPRREGVNNAEVPCDIYGNAIIELMTLPYLLSRVHLYSDGGLDVSEDGEYLFTCAILPAQEMAQPEAADWYQLLQPNSNGGGALPTSAVAATKRSFDQLQLTNPTPPRINSPGNSTGGEAVNVAPFPALGASNSRNRVGPYTSNGVSRLMMPSSQSLPQAAGADMNVSDARPTSAVPHHNTRRFPHLHDLTTNMQESSRSEGQDGAGNGSDRGNGGGGNGGEDRSLLWRMVAGGSGNGKAASALPVPPSQGQPHSSSLLPSQQTGSRGGGINKEEDYLALFKLINIKTRVGASEEGARHYEHNGHRESQAFGGSGPTSAANIPRSPIVPVRVMCKPLTGHLMRAITSTKLSPSLKYGLIGFGVRTEGAVFGHSKSDVACEIINLSTMSTACLLTDEEDEVNIAQFHPLAGNGILYGTKKGKIRKFQRRTQLKYFDGDDNDDLSDVDDDQWEDVMEGGEQS